MKPLIIIVGVLIAFFLVFAIQQGWLTPKENIRKDGVEGTGIVLKKYKNLNPKKSKPEYFVHIKIDGIAMDYNYSKIMIQKDKFDNLQEGQAVNIIYLPSKPSAAVLK